MRLGDIHMPGACNERRYPDGCGINTSKTSCAHRLSYRGKLEFIVYGGRLQLTLRHRASVCFVRAAMLVCEQHTPRPCVYYVTSDSSAAKRNFRAGIERRGGAVVSGERGAVHIDHMSKKGDAASLIDRASPDYIDWFMLTQVRRHALLLLAQHRNT